MAQDIVRLGEALVGNLIYERRIVVFKRHTGSPLPLALTIPDPSGPFAQHIKGEFETRLYR